MNKNEEVREVFSFCYLESTLDAEDTLKRGVKSKAYGMKMAPTDVIVSETYTSKGTVRFQNEK